MRILVRAAPGLWIGVLFGLFESSEVLHRQHTISVSHLALLIFYALLFDAIAFGFLISILPVRWTNFLRNKIATIILTIGILCLVILVVLQVRLSPHHSIAQTSQPDQPNIILISIDTLRFDHLGSYGYKNARTPNLDALAHESAVFENATSPIPLTGPSHVTMLTGQYPITHGVGANGIRLPATVKTIPEILRNAGYRTGAFISGWTLKDESVGLADRFDAYEDELGLSPFFPDVGFELIIPHFAAVWAEKYLGLELRQLELPAEITTKRAVAWLEKKDDQPFFAFVHYFDPHGPHTDPARSRIHTPQPAFDYNKPAPEILKMIRNPSIVRETIHAYDLQISYADSQLGILLESVKKLKRKTIVIFTADHGESLTEHGFYFDHGEFLYETCVHIPMMIRFPDHSYANKRISTQVRLIDLASTVLEAAKLPADTNMEGSSILRVLDGSDHSRDGYGAIRLGAGIGERSRYYIRSGGFKLIWNYDNRLAFSSKPQYEELYDLTTDPGEEHNLTGTNPLMQDQLRSKLMRFISRDKNMKTKPDENVIEQLKALGYTD